MSPEAMSKVVCQSFYLYNNFPTENPQIKKTFQQIILPELQKQNKSHYFDNRFDLNNDMFFCTFGRRRVFLAPNHTFNGKQEASVLNQILMTS